MNDADTSVATLNEPRALSERQVLTIAASAALFGLAVAGTYYAVSRRSRSNEPLYAEPLRRLMDAAHVLGGEAPPAHDVARSPVVKSMLMTVATALVKYGFQQWLRANARRGVAPPDSVSAG